MHQSELSEKTKAFRTVSKVNHVVFLACLRLLSTYSVPVPVPTEEQNAFAFSYAFQNLDPFKKMDGCEKARKREWDHALDVIES